MFSKRIEYSITIIGILVGLILVAHGLLIARTNVRDDLRVQDLTHLRHALEQYNNLTNFYVTPPAGQPNCTSSRTDSWFFGDNSPLIMNHVIDAIPHDVREKKGYVYTYCVTDSKNGQAQGYYLEARLENSHPLGAGFDEDEQRKFFYQIMVRNNIEFYRVCGGTNTTCQAAAKESN